MPWPNYRLVIDGTVELNNGQVLHNVHDGSVCQGRPCTIHNISDHHMIDWPEGFDGILWRECPHTQLHPDPDEAKFYVTAWEDHSLECDGCCQPPHLRLSLEEITDDLRSMKEDYK